MGNFVKDHLFAQMVEYGMRLSNNASVLKDHFGVATPVYQFKNVQEDNILIQLFKNAHAFQVLIGMEDFAFNAQMVGLGIFQHQDALAQLVLLKLEMDVVSNKYVQVENNGFKIHGVVNVQLVQSGMVISVLLIHVNLVKFGINL